MQKSLFETPYSHKASKRTGLKLFWGSQFTLHIHRKQIGHGPFDSDFDPLTRRSFF